MNDVPGDHIALRFPDVNPIAALRCCQSFAAKNLVSLHRAVVDATQVNAERIALDAAVMHLGVRGGDQDAAIKRGQIAAGIANGHATDFDI